MNDLEKKNNLYLLEPWEYVEYTKYRKAKKRFVITQLLSYLIFSFVLIVMVMSLSDIRDISLIMDVYWRVFDDIIISSVVFLLLVKRVIDI